MELFTLTIVLAAVFGAVHLYLKWTKNYWRRRGVESLDKNVTNSRDIINEAYSYFRSKGLKYGGFTVLFKSMFVAVDLDLIKLILIKNFDHFVNHGIYYNEKSDPLSAHVFSLEDDKWRNLRSKLSPSFTSGQMKMMFQTMIACTTPLVEVLKKETKLGEPIDVKDFMARYTTDVIASAGFGIECNSLNDPNCEFRQYGKKVVMGSWRRKVTQMVPKSILRLIDWKPTDPYKREFIMNLVTNLIDYREKNNVYRKDFMHLLLQLKNRGTITDDDKIMENNQKKEYLTLYEIAAQCQVFLVAGFETSSGLMTFALLELAMHQKEQEKLREEVKRVVKKHGDMTYEAIMEVNYLDQVVAETLRLHPPGYATNRICSKDFQIPGTDVVIEKGTNVFIPIYGIQHDPEYYPEPNEFKPDRFSREEKASRHPMAHIPFGEGPRMCIGARFGLLQSKVGLACVVSNFKVTLNRKTQVPIEYSHSGLTLAVKGDVWLNFEPLDQ